MSLRLFEGAAGTGKTTRLIDAARAYLKANPLSEGQRVLALTKYHGSRKRMDTKLTGLGAPIQCLTIDSFAWRLVRRWRGLVRHLGGEPPPGDFQAITSAAGSLLTTGVGAWVARAFPIVVVDEMQDCKGGEIRVLAGLESHAHCLAAADGFQDLSGDAVNEAIDWGSGLAEVVALRQVFRTSQHGILDAAQALRNGESLASNRPKGFEVLSVHTAALGGAVTNWRIKSWSRHGQLAVISPTTKVKSRFVAQLTDWCTEKSAKTSRSNETAGPYRLPWQRSDNDVCADLKEALGLPADLQERIGCARLQQVAIEARAADLADWLRRQRLVLGRSEVTAGEVVAEIEQVVRRRRAYGAGRSSHRLALTVHQAKNREFDCVIVLWPLAVKKGLERQRRLLYNAITRAKRHALVIVEDPRKSRLEEPLFSGGPA